MKDLHSHLLFGIDDGSKTIEESETNDRGRGGRGGRDNLSDGQRETRITITKVEEKGNSGDDNGSSIRKKYAKKKRF